MPIQYFVESVRFVFYPVEILTEHLDETYCVFLSPKDPGQVQPQPQP